MSSSFLGVSVYLLEWFLSVVALPQGDFKTATWCLEIASGATRAATQRIDGHKNKKTHRHCVRLNDVSFEGLVIHSTTTANGHGCLFFVAFRFQFGGVWYDNHGISEETTRKAQNSRSVGFFGLPLRLRGALLSRKLFGRRRGKWDFPTLNRKLMIFKKPQNDCG